MRLVLLKSLKFANQAGYYLQNGRWHAINKDKAAPKGAPKAAHPHAAGKPVQKETLADHEWAQLKLPDTNTNAGTFNKQLDQLKAAAAAGDVTGILASGYGTNTYGKKLAIIANHVLGLLGSDHKVTPGQKAGTHAAVQTAPQIEAEQKAEQKPEAKPADQPAAGASDETVKAPSKDKSKGEASDPLSIPEFAEGVKAKNVKKYYEGVAKKIISAAKAGDLSALQFMPTDKGNTWKGKTENSKKLMALHQAAIEHAKSVKGAGKEVEHPDAKKNAAKEAKALENETGKKPTDSAHAEDGNWTMPLKDAIAEHEDLVAAAETPTKADDKAELAEQKKELGKMKQAAKEAKAPDEPKFTDKGSLAGPSGYAKTFANLKQANAAAEKLKAQGHDVYVTAQHPYQVKKNDAAKAEAKKPEPEKKPEPAKTEQPSGAAEKLAQIPWDGMLLPDSNKNAKSHNKQVAKIKAMAEAGDIEGLKNFKAGINTYGKKQNLLAQTALAALEESAADKEPVKQPKTETKPEEKPEPAPEKKQDTEADDVKADKPVKPVKPDIPTVSGFHSVVNSIEEAMNAGNASYLETQVLMTANMSSSVATKAHQYAKDALAYVQGNPVSDENDGPQEGETKQGADGMLVFHNGRWHKQDDVQGEKKTAAVEKPAPKGPADVEIPVFEGMSSVHNKMFAQAAEALKAKVSAEGKAGFKGVLTNHKTGAVTVNINGIKIGKASITSKTPAFANFAKFVDELKASVGSAKKPKAAPKTEKLAQTAAEPAPEQLESMDHWEQIGPQGGSNPGGKFKDQDGVEWYCKFPTDADTAKAEVLAAKLYTELGLSAQDAKLITKDGKIGIASRWTNVKKASAKELAETPGVLDGFAADAWLANWDVVGLAYDNLQVDEKGHAMRVDAGGSLMYRAQGGKKAFGDVVTELDSLRDPKINPQAAAVFGKMTDADITASVAKVAQISDAKIRMIVAANGPGTKEEKKALADTLIARKNDLLAKYPKAAKVPKKRLDPENLPVNPDELPKRHDFANWNGPGNPLSSKSHVNESNQQAEDEMLKIAKSGNLNQLKEYKFQPVDKDTGKPVGEPKPISEHPSKHVVQYHADLVQMLDELANPPQPLKIFQESDVNTLDELEMAFPPKKFGTTVNAVHSNEKLGFWVVLGGVLGTDKFKPKKVMNFTHNAVDAAYVKFKEASKLAKHFVHSVQASGTYNDLFREGKEYDNSGYKLSDVAQAALDFATEQPEGTSLYRWQHMTKDMVNKIMSAPDGTVFQATGPMCTSMSPTATSHFGPHRITIRYAQGAKAVESFGSGKFAGEKEVTTLPNSRFVILKKELVPSEKGKGDRLELEVLMLPPDLGL